MDGVAGPVDRNYRSALASHCSGQAAGAVGRQGFIVGAQVVEALKKPGLSNDALVEAPQAMV
jgi:hypothetical protein